MDTLLRLIGMKRTAEGKVTVSGRMGSRVVYLLAGAASAGVHYAIRRQKNAKSK